MFIIFNLVTFGPPRWAMAKFGSNMLLFHSVVNEVAVGFSIFSFHRRIHLRDQFIEIISFMLIDLVEDEARIQLIIGENVENFISTNT
ncbi:putative phosphomethylpyrimidine kinase/hydroxymethylpyrimidine kinase [Trichinella spiralis]|uniref:putative phosphomethylpyrimidine kinase/hydroxymethylpyrimidine kinase n=1 Tax=Trichinella spiralis TaxID=6334 RepID=UPI0001EFBD1D|nr:putative phosphomethylpyrimidine kinase/hydroxymethylpyrimidine kinase [Trichinella spiralis]